MVTFSAAPKGQFKVLYVDDELLSLKYFQEIVGDEFPVITAPSAEEGRRIVEEHHESIGVVVSDQKLGGMQGTTFLSGLRDRFPDIVRILATAFSDMNTAVSAINDGAIYQYISKPWEPERLMRTVQRAMEQFLLRAERERLLREKAGMVRDLIVSDRMAGYGVLAEGLNHHLRNALVPVEVYLQLAEVAAESPEDNITDPVMLGQMRQSARSQVRRIIDILGRLSSMKGREASGREELVAVDELWEEVIAQMAGPLGEKQIRINISCDEHLPRVSCNRNRLAQVMRLVLEDELERLGNDDDIRIVVEHRPGSDTLAEHVLTEISDSGPDVDESRLGSVFTPFSMRRETPHYVGLNLATSYMTLCGLGGWAHAFNDHDRGTVIALSVPLGGQENVAVHPSLEAWERVLGSVDEVALP